MSYQNSIVMVSMKVVAGIVVYEWMLYTTGWPASSKTVAFARLGLASGD